jgi:hypothetical protein
VRIGLSEFGEEGWGFVADGSADFRVEKNFVKRNVRVRATVKHWATIGGEW